MSLTGCNSNPTKQEIGTVSGAVIGGIVGSALTAGSTAGTVVGPTHPMRFSIVADVWEIAHA